MKDCKHCGREVRYSTPRGWFHTGTNSAFCEGLDRRIAEPKR